MADEKISRLVDVANMYYILNYSQQEIAKKLNVSRPTVSRLLEQAKQEGIVHIRIIDPVEDHQKLAKLVQKKFQLKNCLIANIADYSDDLIKVKLGELAADYIQNIVNDGDIIGITWGTTLYQVAKSMGPKNVKDVVVVQLNGGVSYSESNTYASEIVNAFAKAFNTSPYFLPLPAVVDQVLVKQAMVADQHIKKVLDLGRKANIAVLTVGEPGQQSTLMKAGYFSEEDVEILDQNRTVGDICSRLFDRNGRITNEPLNERTIGIELNDLREKSHSILVGGGMNKVEGIYGALKGKYVNMLITDQFTAKSLLETEEGGTPNESGTN
jgi:deoxyribonucleoside regulator